MRTSLLGVEGVMDTGEHTQNWERNGNENTGWEFDVGNVDVHFSRFSGFATLKFKETFP